MRGARRPLRRRRADAEDGAGRLADDFVGVRPGRAVVERTMRLEAEHDEIRLVVSCESEDGWGGFAGEDMTLGR